MEPVEVSPAAALLRALMLLLLFGIIIALTLLWWRYLPDPWRADPPDTNDERRFWGRVIVWPMQLFKAAALLLFFGTNFAFLQSWRGQLEIPTPRPVLIGLVLLFVAAWWDKPWARGMFGGIAAMEVVGLLLSGAGMVGTLIALVVLTLVWAALARFP